jgi:hypothetical protein
MRSRLPLRPGRWRFLARKVGGWPAYVSGEAPVDTARDGIPDVWKRAHGLPLNDPNVANAVNADGYTMLEVYLNSLVTP